jgi:hypothetical protein
MAEWNRRREASDSDREDIERSDKREDLQHEIFSPSSKVTGWSASEAMRELRDTLFPADRIEIADSKIEKWKSQEAWTTEDGFSQLRRDEAELNQEFADLSTRIVISEEKQMEYLIDPMFEGESIQLLKSNCAPTALSNMIRDTFGILPEGGQEGTTKRARDSGVWGSDGVEAHNFHPFIQDELERLGIEAEVQWKFAADFNQEALIAACNSGAGVLAGLPGHEVQVVAATPESVTILDPGIGRRITLTAEDWDMIVEDYEIVRRQEREII